MSSESNSADLRAQCEARSAAVELQMRRLWIPGRRKRLVNVFYDIGQVAREAGAFDLSEKYFRTAIGLMHGRKPWRWNNSLSILSTVAACHNLLGIQYDNSLATDCNQLLLLKFPQSQCDGFSCDANQAGKILMRQFDIDQYPLMNSATVLFHQFKQQSQQSFTV